MLSQGKVCPTIAVNDLARAKEFYESTLGLTVKDELYGGVLLESGGGTGVFLYESEFAGTNKATYATWEVADIEAVVEDLKGKGVEFEHYDMPETELQGDLHVMGEMKSAWFKDPDGNILAVNQSARA